jgi:hypothetical protein
MKRYKQVEELVNQKIRENSVCEEEREASHAKGTGERVL